MTDTAWLESGDVPTHELNLDLPPVERWRTIAAAYVEAFDAIVASSANAELFAALQTVPAFVALLARRALPPRQREDVLALEALLGLPRGLLSLLQLVYEVFSLTDILQGRYVTKRR